MTYQGSTFQEVRDLVFSDPYVELPSTVVTLRSQFKGVSNLLLRDDRSLVAEQTDIAPHFNKLAHPIGICMSGTWTITEDSPYTGVFEKGTEALVVARCSSVIGRNDRDKFKRRGMGFAAKIFPTMDPDERVETVNLITIDDLGGTTDKRYTDRSLTNEPGLTPSLSLLRFLAAFINVVVTFAIADKKITYRPMYPLAEVGLDARNAKTPHWVKIHHDPTNGQSDEPDLRNELNVEHYREGVLRFTVSVAPKSADGTRVYSPIGEIALHESVVSASGDHRIRFRHQPNRGHAEA